MEEVWKDIYFYDFRMDEWIDYRGYYQVSNYGRVKSLNYSGCKGKEKILKQTFGKDGYLRVSLTKDRKIKTIRVHRLVAQTFIENKENKPCVDHISTVKTDNRVENLRFVTHKENSNNELTRKHNSESKKGKKHTEETRQKISKASKGKVVSEETRQKMSKASKGRKHTEEAKRKMSEANKGRNNSSYKGFVCIFPDGNITEEMFGKELGELLRISEDTIIKIAKSGEPYKPFYKRLKHLAGIKIYYAKDYLKLESGDSNDIS